MDAIKESSVKQKIHEANGVQSEDNMSEASDVKDIPRPKKSIVKTEGPGDEEVSRISPSFRAIKLLVHEMSTLLSAAPGILPLPLRLIAYHPTTLYRAL